MKNIQYKKQRNSDMGAITLSVIFTLIGMICLLWYTIGQLLEISQPILTAVSWVFVVDVVLMLVVVGYILMTFIPSDDEDQP